MYRLDCKMSFIHFIFSFQIVSSFDTTQKKLITDAIKHWEDVTCIRFHVTDVVPRDKPYLVFVKGGGCYSNVGRIVETGSQEIVLGSSYCFKVYISNT